MLNNKFVNQTIADLSKELSVPTDFFNQLVDENDWSFIIKLHALIETAVTYLLVHKAGYNELVDIFSFLELSNKKIGKVAFAKALGLLNSEERRYINALSEIRNTLVHNITNVNFTLDNYTKRLNDPQRKNFITAFGYVHKDKKYVLDTPKASILRGGMFLLSRIYLTKESIRLKKEIVKLKLETIENLGAPK